MRTVCAGPKTDFGAIFGLLQVISGQGTKVFQKVFNMKVVQLELLYHPIMTDFDKNSDFELAIFCGWALPIVDSSTGDDIWQLAG